MVDGNRQKFQPLAGGGEGGGVCSMHIGICDLKHVKIIWGNLVHFS